PGSQQPHSDVTLPAGTAMRLEAYHGLYFQEHFINATQAPMTTRVSYRLGTVDAARVRDAAGMIFYSNFDLFVPPGRSTATETCRAPRDLSLMLATGHMHKRG